MRNNYADNICPQRTFHSQTNQPIETQLYTHNLGFRGFDKRKKGGKRGAGGRGAGFPSIILFHFSIGIEH